MSERATRLAAIRERDDKTADSWFEDELPVDLVARAIQDRRWLLTEIDRLITENQALTSGVGRALGESA
jgi:hypothetical protein